MEDSVWPNPPHDSYTTNGNDSLGSSHGEDQVDMGPTKPKDIETGLDQWKSTVESSISGLEVYRSYQTTSFWYQSAVGYLQRRGTGQGGLEG